MRSIQRRLFKTFLLAGGASTLVLAAPAAAQDTPDIDPERGADVLDRNQAEVLNPTQAPAPRQQADTAIVVTGSRIVRRDFEANSPIVTVDEALFEQSSTAALESNLNKLPQFVPAQTPTLGGDIQPTATNTPGAATISLRGIGTNRNLVLLDGRRATPGNASGVVDISTIPAAAIERVEVISGGASATYGADAVAGVTNFILKKNFLGLELDGQMGFSQEGDGFEYQLSGIMGADFDDGRGNVSFAMSWNLREPSFQRDREWYRDLWTNPDVGGTAFRLDHPGVAFTGANPFSDVAADQVFPGASPPIPTNATIYVGPDGSAFTGSSFATRGGVPFFNQPLDGFPYKLTSAGTIAKNETDLYLVLPLTRYNMFTRGSYEITDSIGIFAQGLYSHVSTRTLNAPGPITGGWGASIPFGNQTYTGDASRGIPSSVEPQFLPNGDPNPRAGQTTAPYLPGGRFGLNCSPVGGCTTAEVFPVPEDLETLLLGREDPNAPFSLVTLLPNPRETFTDVSTYNLLAGLEGEIPGMAWTWEAFINHGESETYALQTGIASLERVRTVLTSPNFGQGFRQQGNAQSGGFGASTGTCTSGLNFFTPPEGGFSEDCLEAISADLQNRSTTRQTIAEFNAQGEVFDLPAGPLQAAVGASYRELDFEFINDTLTTQGRSFLDQALGIYPSSNSSGFIEAKEVYGELLVPVIGDLPFVENFSLEVGGRISDYNTTGTSYTYKILGDWEINHWLRFRGGYNRAERSPNIAELFLAPQQTFGVNNVGDACSLLNPNEFSANPATNPNAANVEAVCRLIINRNDPTNQAQFNFYGGGPQDLPISSGAQSTATFGYAWPTVIGNENLTPEKADTWTAGVVIQSPFDAPALSRLRLSIDWFKIQVEDAIGVQSVGVAQRQCFDPAFNPAIATDPAAASNSQFCQNLSRNLPGGEFGNVNITYANNGRFEVEGVDASLDWGMDLGPGALNINALINYLIDFKVAELPVDPLVDYVGTFGTTGNGLNPGAYEYKIFTTVGYSVGPARLALQWQHLPSVEDSAEVLIPGGTSESGAPSYSVFALNGSYQLLDNLSIRFGVENLFDKAPPLTGVDTNADLSRGELPGGSFNSLFYDTLGRRFFLGANVEF